MIDYFALGLTHALMALAAWRLMTRADLDRADREPGATTAQRKPRRAPPGEPGDA